MTLEQLAGGLVVSCQAYPGEPMRDPRTMAQVASAAEAGGARAIRAQGIDDIVAVVAATTVPVIGIWKDGTEGVMITPTLRHALAVIAAGAHIVAIDGTRRPRPDGLTLAETVAGIREVSDAPIMADCGSLEDALAAEKAGAHLLGTTLAGYTGERPRGVGPDFEVLAAIVAGCRLPVIAEGRMRTPEDAERALAMGALAVCVGTAITHPASITRQFADAMARVTAR